MINASADIEELFAPYTRGVTDFFDAAYSTWLPLAADREREWSRAATAKRSRLRATRRRAKRAERNARLAANPHTRSAYSATYYDKNAEAIKAKRKASYAAKKQAKGNL